MRVQNLHDTDIQIIHGAINIKNVLVCISMKHDEKP